MVVKHKLKELKVSLNFRPRLGDYIIWRGSSREYRSYPRHMPMCPPMYRANSESFLSEFPSPQCFQVAIRVHFLGKYNKTCNRESIRTVCTSIEKHKCAVTICAFCSRINVSGKPGKVVLTVTRDEHSQDKRPDHQRRVVVCAFATFYGSQVCHTAYMWSR